MKSRRWFVTEELKEWRWLVARRMYFGPFFSFPDASQYHESMNLKWWYSVSTAEKVDQILKARMPESAPNPIRNARRYMHDMLATESARHGNSGT